MFCPPFPPPSGAGQVPAGNEPKSGASDTQHHLPGAGVLESLPTIRRTGKHYLSYLSLVEDDVESFVEEDLSVARLNDIHSYLWMAGRPFNARSLQRLRMIEHEVIITDKADLHLLKVSKRIFVKPLPKYILDYGFWTKYLCSSKNLHKSACGFLLSYLWLIRSPFDLRLAKELNLIQDDMEWLTWKAFVKDFMGSVDVNVLDMVNERYQFGELRLGRINTIYRTRFMFSKFVRGYLYEYNRYVPFFDRNFGWLLSVFVYFSIILSAMEVGSSVPPLSESLAFQRASYGFVTFSIVGVVAFLAFISAVFSWIYLYNMVEAIRHTSNARKERERRSGKRWECI